MALYSFKGHYPVEQIDNNKGWYEVPAKPEAPEGKQVAWVNAEWVVRDPKPEDRPGFQWNWNHGEMAWVECEYPQTAEVVTPDFSLVITDSDSISTVVGSEPITFVASGSDSISLVIDFVTSDSVTGAAG
jgi:hypothetical protein